MKVKVLNGRFLFNGKIYEKGDEISSPPLSKEKMDYLLKLAQKMPYILEIRKSRRDESGDK